MKNLSRFRENAYGAVFRNDGRLIVAGSEETNVKLFDMQTKNLLRLFKGHTAPVHRTFFIPNQPQIVSFSDDKSVRLWDIGTEKTLFSYNDHTDYIRAGAVHPLSPNVLLSGGYDNIVRMYDSRTNQTIAELNHGSPVESLLFLPSGGLFFSAGGTEIKIWDGLMSGKQVGCVSQHHKTITCLRLTSDSKRLLSSSLDRHVKIYDTVSFKAVHTLDYPNAVLSLGVSKDNETVVAGMVDGLVSVSRREINTEDEEKERKSSKKVASYRYKTQTFDRKVDTIIRDEKKEKYAVYETCLRKFEYTKALSTVLQPYVANKSPHITVIVIQELIRRRAFQKSLNGCDKKMVAQMLRFFIRNLTDYRFTRILIDAVNIFLDEFEEKVSQLPVEVGTLFVELTKLLREESDLCDNLAQLQGVMDMLLTGQSSINSDSEVLNSKSEKLTPSSDAQKNFVLCV